jgi:RNA polymerase sigma factor (sigma-70 family)
MRLALWMVGTNRWIQQLNMEEEDKVSYAYEGLIKAVDKFNPQYGAFSTYAYKRIILQMMHGYREQLKNKSGIAFTALEDIDKLTDVENEFKAQGVKPTAEDLAVILTLPVEKAKELLRLRNTLLNINSYEEIKESESETSDRIIDNASDGDAIQETESGYVLDGVYVEPEDVPSYEESYIGYDDDATSSNIEDKFDTGMLRKQLDTALDTLKAREKGVLQYRYGLDGGSQHTLEETGRLFFVTKERIRQIEAKALRKLRHPSRTKLIRGFLENMGKEGYTIRYTRKTVNEKEPYDIMTPVDDSVNITTATEILRYTDNEERNKYTAENLSEDLEEENFAEFFDSEEEEELENEQEEFESIEETSTDSKQTTEEIKEEIKEIEESENPSETEDVEIPEEIEDVEEMETFDTVDEEIDAIRNEYLSYKEKESEIDAKLANYQEEINQILSVKEPIQKRIARVERLTTGENAEFLLVEMGQKDVLERIKEQALEDLKIQEEKEKQARAKYDEAEQEKLEIDEQKEEVKKKIDKFFDEL